MEKQHDITTHHNLFLVKSNKWQHQLKFYDTQSKNWNIASYLKLFRQDGVLPQRIDPEPLISVVEGHLSSLDVPHHPPVNVVTPHLLHRTPAAPQGLRTMFQWLLLLDSLYYAPVYTDHPQCYGLRTLGLPYSHCSGSFYPIQFSIYQIWPLLMKTK